MPQVIGRILCFLGLHDYALIDATFSFGSSGGIRKLRCNRCGKIRTEVT
jgi:hypothetical protein